MIIFTFPSVLSPAQKSWLALTLWNWFRVTGEVKEKEVEEPLVRKERRNVE